VGAVFVPLAIRQLIGAGTILGGKFDPCYEARGVERKNEEL
jgi:hypothetical protein